MSLVCSMMQLYPLLGSISCADDLANSSSMLLLNSLSKKERNKKQNEEDELPVSNRLPKFQKAQG